jgi:hypothetical protein
MADHIALSPVSGERVRVRGDGIAATLTPALSLEGRGSKGEKRFLG